MELQKIISKFRLQPEQIELVQHESHSSHVYKLTLKSQESLILKIPFSREKLFRESKMLQRLSGLLPVPTIIDQWNRDEDTAGALLLSFIDGNPSTNHAVKIHFEC